MNHDYIISVLIFVNNITDAETYIARRWQNMHILSTRGRYMYKPAVSNAWHLASTNRPARESDENPAN